MFSDWKNYYLACPYFLELDNRGFYIETTLKNHCFKELLNRKMGPFTAKTIQGEILNLLQKRKMDFVSASNLTSPQKESRHISVSSDLTSDLIEFYQSLPQDQRMTWFLNFLNTDFIFYWVEPELLCTFLQQLTYVPTAERWRLARDLELIHFCNQVKEVVNDDVSDDPISVSITCNNLDNPFAMIQNGIF